MGNDDDDEEERAIKSDADIIASFTHSKAVDDGPTEADTKHKKEQFYEKAGVRRRRSC